MAGSRASEGQGFGVAWWNRPTIHVRSGFLAVARIAEQLDVLQLVVLTTVETHPLVSGHAVMIVSGREDAVEMEVVGATAHLAAASKLER